MALLPRQRSCVSQLHVCRYVMFGLTRVCVLTCVRFTYVPVDHWQVPGTVRTHVHYVRAYVRGVGVECDCASPRLIIFLINNVEHRLEHLVADFWDVEDTSVRGGNNNHS